MGGETDTDQENEAINPDEFSSANIGLEETRRRFDLEEKRSDVIETKAGTIFALNAIIISAISLLEDIYTTSKIIIVVLAMISAVQALRVLRTHNYQRPMQHSRNISRYISLSQKEFEKKFIELYIESIENNKRINNDRIGKYQWALWLTVLTILIFAIVSIGSQIPPLSDVSPESLYSICDYNYP
ncbi:hypothetical protein ACFO5R_07980 [Halosolutus amylolyticus]|uniref:SMODS and SLOG-associating 2TM effector domain-containing protein n=1 Tax=Halosolutus amylolyticus TaxID=2932267 RepID=A0ABD5PMQ2_9EURY|nr:hypothetical protein [Halosolutus amylolyticus]